MTLCMDVRSGRYLMEFVKVTVARGRFMFANMMDGTNWLLSDGVCKDYGGKRKKYECKHDGCTNWAVSGSVCLYHGGRTRKRCSHDECIAYDF
jgi:hypothetical protein